MDFFLIPKTLVSTLGGIACEFPEHTHERASLRPAARLTAALGAFLVVSAAAAADAGTVRGRMTYDGRVYALQHVYAWQAPLQDGELWIYLTDRLLPPEAARDDNRPGELAREKRFGGIKLIVSPVRPRLDDIRGVVYAPHDDGYAIDSFNFGPSWQELQIGNRRVSGKLSTNWMNWTLEAEFTAPVEGATGSVRTITGAAAQHPPHAVLFIAFEQVLVEGGLDLDAAGGYLTPARLAEMRARLQRFGAASVAEFQAGRRCGTPQGE